MYRYYQNVKNYSYCEDNRAVEIPYEKLDRYVVIDNSGFPQNLIFPTKLVDLEYNFTTYISI